MRSADAAHDGQFVFAVATTGVFCRPSCSARRPRRENVEFFAAPDQAEKAGYRACLRCRPKSLKTGPADSMKAICRYIEHHLDEPITLERLGAEFHQSPFHLQRRFKAVLGITPREYADSCRLRQLTPRDTVFTTDVGAIKSITSQAWRTYEPLTFFESNGLSAMCYSLPAAMAPRFPMLSPCSTVPANTYVIVSMPRCGCQGNPAR